MQLLKKLGYLIFGIFLPILEFFIITPQFNRARYYDGKGDSALSLSTKFFSNLDLLLPIILTCAFALFTLEIYQFKKLPKKILPYFPALLWAGSLIFYLALITTTYANDFREIYLYVFSSEGIKDLGLFYLPILALILTPVIGTAIYTISAKKHSGKDWETDLTTAFLIVLAFTGIIFLSTVI